MPHERGMTLVGSMGVGARPAVLWDHHAQHALSGQCGEAHGVHAKKKICPKKQDTQLWERCAKQRLLPCAFSLTQPCFSPPPRSEEDLEQRGANPAGGGRAQTFLGAR
mmetsp:Transcript_20619/g.41822  ORF Transcript_20619/g.41822 Transcript_20619/m.41822 type:complete len:108 (+) Transcript_20619:488-811(+)